jgi:hypothetical protein
MVEYKRQIERLTERIAAETTHPQPSPEAFAETSGQRSNYNDAREPIRISAGARLRAGLAYPLKHERREPNVSGEQIKPL